MRAWPRRAFAAAAFAGLLLAAGGPAWAQQPNFAPLERGDYTEVEERIIVMRGLEVGADYSLRLTSNNQNELPPGVDGTNITQDLRLRLNTNFHRDVQLKLTLELSDGRFRSAALREAPEEEAPGGLSDGLALGLEAREAYLRWNLNPRSGLLLGKQELSLADRRGKLFHALVPAITFDCEAGTWCMPFGFATLGPQNRGFLIHYALQYNAFDEQRGNLRDHLSVEVFRLRYSEQDIPLGTNLGPARFNADDPLGDFTAGGVGPHPSQLLQPNGNPVYYDADSQDFFGLRINWANGGLFANLDVVGYRGPRRYHLLTDPDTGVRDELSSNNADFAFLSSRGTVVETEFGLRWEAGRVGLRAMSATGDPFVQDTNGQSFQRDVGGYHEITPGAYRGSRLWFNGANVGVEDGAGLGHSVNNTQLVGVFLSLNLEDVRNFSYAGGIYQLSLNEPIPNTSGALQTDIGIEINNLFSWRVHKALRLQVEGNMIFAGGAFRVDDFSTPVDAPDNLVQVLGRVVYSF